MKRYFGFILAALAAVFLLGCFGSGGSSAPPPTHVDVVAKDSRVVVTWDVVPGVQYWIFKANGSGVTPQNCSSMPLCSTAINVTSPYSFGGLYNDLPYSFSINARTGGGAGGAGSTAVETTPRMAGKIWETGTTQPGGDLRGLAYGASGAKFVAAGLSGALYSGTVTTTSAGLGVIEGLGVINWTSLASVNPPSTASTHFYAVNYDASRGNFYVIGASGAVIMNTPASSTAWTLQTSNAGSNDLYAMANNGAGLLVAVGDHGKIITSTDGSTWTAQTSPTTNALYGVTYGYDTANATYRFVAVGAAGTVVWGTTTDGGVTWTWRDVTSAASSATNSVNLNSVTFGGYDMTTATLGYGMFVAVGNGGTVVTSLDGMTWTSQALTSTIPASSNLNAVTYYGYRRFMAVGNDGAIYYSEYQIPTNGMVWTAATSVTSSALHAVATGALYDYAAVGAGGINFYADRASY